MPNVPNQGFPIDGEMFPLGVISQKTLSIDGKRCLPVIELKISNCQIDELKILHAEAEKRKRFGSMYHVLAIENNSSFYRPFFR